RTCPCDLLSRGLARLLPHARVRTRRDRLHERPGRREGDRQLVDAREALGGRARAGGRHVAAVPPMPSRGSRADRAVHAPRPVRRALVVAVAGVALAAPAAAWAHAALLRTVPEASVTTNVPPRQVRLVYSEAVEPRFAVVSVTD